MNREQAQHILLAYRLGEMGDGDSHLAEALELAAHDPALMAWLEQELATDRLVRERLREVSPPMGLRERILAAPRIVLVPWWRMPSACAAAAALVLAIGTSAWWWSTMRDSGANSPALGGQRPGAPRGEASLADFQQEMVEFVATGAYSLQLQSDSLAEVKRFLSVRGAEVGVALPETLEKLRTYGCQILDWHGSRVTLICFQVRGVGIAHLFIVDAATFQDSPTLEKVFTSLDTWSAARWRDGGQALVFCAPSDSAELRRLIDG